MLLVAVRADGQEVVAVPDRLHEHEGPVEDERGDGRERELGRRELGTGAARRERRQNEAERGQVDTVASAAPASALNVATRRSAPGAARSRRCRCR